VTTIAILFNGNISDNTPWFEWFLLDKEIIDASLCSKLIKERGLL
jgi:hypothetical protein